jgi:dUTP pyrophosphatase
MPTKAHKSDCGHDVYFCPSETENQEIHVSPGESKLFSTGLKFNFPSGYCVEIKNRSGMASKKSLLVGACIIDPSYTGTVFVNLHNVGLRGQTIHAGDKIAQLICYAIQNEMELMEVTPDKYQQLTEQSIRGAGGFGSSGF